VVTRHWSHFDFLSKTFVGVGGHLAIFRDLAKVDWSGQLSDNKLLPAQFHAAAVTTSLMEWAGAFPEFDELV